VAQDGTVRSVIALRESPLEWGRTQAAPSGLADIFGPHLGMRGDVITKQSNALIRVQIDNAHTDVPEPVDPALEVHRFANHHGPDPKLPNEPTAVPTGRERADQDTITVISPSTGFAECVRLRVCGWIAILHPPVMPSTEQVSVSIVQRSADGNAAFIQPGACFGKRHLQHALEVERQHPFHRRGDLSLLQHDQIIHRLPFGGRAFGRNGHRLSIFRYHPPA